MSDEKGSADKKYKWVRVPVIEPLDIRQSFEHTPLDYFRYGEYPKFLRPIGAHQPRTEWKLVEDDGKGW